MQTNQPHFIEVGQIRVGLYIHLDLGWMDHPFTLSNFKVKDEEQITKIKQTGLKKLRYDPKRSDCEPMPLPKPASTAQAASVATIAIAAEVIANEVTPAIASKAERLKHLHHAIDENEKKFIIASDITRQITRNIIISPKASIEQATLMVNGMVDTALTEGDIVIHALNGNRSSDENYQHTLNVTVLSLIMAKSIEMTKEDAQLLGLASIFHDLGKTEIPDKILMKKDPLTKSELSYYEQHSEIGARIAKEVGLPVRLAKIILQHHELADGSGYPNSLKANQTDQLARVIALANGYDLLCNPNNMALAKTPYEALAYMYANQRSKFDEPLLKSLIKSLGIYPPGSVVQLSTGVHAVVISVNPGKPLRPFVMLHDPLAKRQEPLILDLREEPNTNISICLRPNQLPPDVLDYLNPRKRISYFIDADLPSNEVATS
jgi:putative nucleotidyltransferase with HDIG domain